MRKPALHGLVVAAVVAAGAGCTSTAVIQSSDVYYGSGPELALQVLDEAYVRPEDRILAGMERAVALEELGLYQESNRALEACLEAIGNSAPEKATDAVAGLLVNDEAGTYRGEIFERVYLDTLRVANSLALQDIDDAASAASAALARMAATPCAACRYPFTRWAAAVAFEAAGDVDRAAEVLAEAVAESPEIPFLQEELERIGSDTRSGSEPGFAPPPAGRWRHRELVVLLLLGRGPVKVEGAVPVPPSHVVAWPRYVMQGPGAVVGARLDLEPGRTVDAAPLTWMEDLADASLKARIGGLMAKEITKTVGQEAVVHGLEEDGHWGWALFGRVVFGLADRADLRHWSSLPASCQAIRVTLPPGLRTCDLVYLASDGSEVEREPLVLPAEWRAGPLFVTRRVP